MLKATKIEITLDASTQRQWDEAEPTRGYRTQVRSEADELADLHRGALVRLLGDNGRIFYETTGERP